MFGLARRWLLNRRAEIVSKECSIYLRRSRRILDLGCGTGHIAARVRQDYKAEIQGVDVARTHEADVPFCLFDGNALPFPDGSFDTTLIIYVLHHSMNPAQLLAEAKRVTSEYIIVYEDIYKTIVDQLLLCSYHWLASPLSTLHRRPKFMKESSWVSLFESVGLQLVTRRETFSCWYDLTKHAQYVLAPQMTGRKTVYTPKEDSQCPLPG